MKGKQLTRRAILAKMQAGNLPRDSGGGTRVVFNDGRWATRHDMRTLRLDGFIASPKHTSLDSPYTLTTKGQE